jgi:hypothetical protein
VRIASSAVKQPGVDIVGQHRRIAVGDVDPAHRDRDDLRAGGLDRRRVLGEILVLAGADDEAGAERPARDRPYVVRRRDRMIPAAHEMHDFQLVAILDDHAGEGGARHDLQIALDRDLLRGKPQVIGEVGNGHALTNAPMLAIHPDADGPVDGHGVHIVLSLLQRALCGHIGAGRTSNQPRNQS